MGNLAGWPYWKDISITGQAGAGTDYQIELEIGDSAGGNFHLEGHCDVFPQDIRITDDDGTTLLDHHVLDLTADPIVVYVEVKDDLGSNRDIRVYYGKSGETTASNGANTYPFYKDWEDGDVSGWSVRFGSATITSETSIVKHGSKSVKFHKTTSIHTGIRLPIGFDIGAEDYILHSWVRSGTGTNYSIIMLSPGDSSSRGPRVWDAIAGTGKYLYYDGSTHDISTGHSLDTWYKHLGTFNHASDTFDWWVEKDESDAKDVSDGNFEIAKATLDYIWVGLGKSAATTSIFYVDDIIIRKYIANGPAFSSAGAEQSAAGAPTGVFYGPLIGPFGGPI